MPVPSTIVTFKDKGGDEFPIRVWVALGDFPQAQIIAAAEEHLEEFEAQDRMKPTHPVAVVSVEALNSPKVGR